MADLNALLNRSWTEEEIQTKLRRSGVLATKNAAIERSALLKRRQAALDGGRDDEVMALDAELAKLQAPKLAFGTSLTKQPSTVKKGPTQQERLAELNRANRRANTEDIRKAQLAEKEAEAKEAAAIARGEATANRFARVKTRAKLVHDVNGEILPVKSSQEIEEEHKSSQAESTTLKKRVAVPALMKRLGDQKGGIPTIRRRAMDDEIIGAMDLAIDIDI